MRSPERVPHPWSDEMEKALIEQSRIVLGRRGGSTATPRTALLVLLAASAIVGMVLLCFANWQ